MNDRTKLPLTASHWGVYRVETHKGRIEKLHPFEHDPAPSPIMQGALDTLDDPLRIRSPMVREAWIDRGRNSPPMRHGDDRFVQIPWDMAEELVASELDRVRKTYGNQAIFGGSYGWASAGRFHHAQSQLHRFLNCIGGYTKSVNSYSLAAGEVILSHILGDASSFIHAPPSWQSVIDHTSLIVAFGGMPVRNSQVTAGGTGYHRTSEGLRQAKDAGVSFVNISPIKHDVSNDLGAVWLPSRPGSDVALMLGLAHEILRNNWHDHHFLEQYTHGFETFAGYLTGRVDGVPKTVNWAAEKTGISAKEIAALAKRMAAERTMISVSWSLTRQEHGEQPFWMATTLAAMLGEIGRPGGGVAFGYGASNSVGMERRALRYAALPQLQNPVETFIPVARIADMLLNPGGPFEYNGNTRQYPDVELVYWAGGNPFHHHQDLTRLSTAWQKPQTVIVHDWCWNSLAKRADIVLPCTTPLEREDLMITPRDRFVVAMAAAIDPIGEARNDHDILRAIARKLDVEDVFTDNKTSEDWLEWIYEESRSMAHEFGVKLPDFATFCAAGWFEVEAPEVTRDAFTAFRDNPLDAPLNTPTGKIEITSKAIESFETQPILPHPAWYEPIEWLGAENGGFAFHLITSQPADKLHSQLDHGRVSRSAKLNGRTPLHIHPDDAEQLNISDGSCVRVFNQRGACLATAKHDRGLLRGVLKMSTGAWLDAVMQDDGTLLCRHGNPNVVTQDHGASVLSQGPSAHSCLVAVEPFETAKKTEAFRPPEILVGEP